MEVSYDRPYDTSTGAGQFFTRDVALVRYLERGGYPVSYTTNTAADLRGAELSEARALLDVGHSEYWSDAGRRAFTRARDAGTSLVFLSSDTLAWRVRFARASRASSEAGRPDHRMVGYKEHAALDPVPAWSPAPSLRPAWLFEGTGFTPGATVPGIVGYELDEASAAAPPGLATVGGGSAPCQTGRVGRAISTLYRALGGARLLLGHARLAARALARSADLARRAARGRSAARAGDRQPAAPALRPTRRGGQ